MPNIENVAQVLDATLSADSTIRQRAEDQLIALSKNEGN